MYQRGLTLVELVIALSILAILLHLAMPSFRDLIDSQRREVAGKDLLSALRSARTEAILRHRAVIVQPLKEDWGQGWRMIADDSGLGLQDPDNPVLVVRQGDGKVRIVGNLRVAKWVRFNALGGPSETGGGQGNGTLHICDQRTGATHLRVIISTSGRVRLDSGPGEVDPCTSTDSLYT